MQEQPNSHWQEEVACSETTSLTKAVHGEGYIEAPQSLDDEKVIDLLRNSELFALIKQTLIKQTSKTGSLLDVQLREALENLAHSSDHLSGAETLKEDGKKSVMAYEDHSQTYCGDNNNSPKIQRQDILLLQ